MKTKHNDSCTMAFGRYSPLGVCPRCDELRSGAAPRQWSGNIKAKLEAQRCEAIRRHYAPGGAGYAKLQSGQVDTAFEW